VYVKDPETYAGGSVDTGRATLLDRSKGRARQKGLHSPCCLEGAESL